MDLFVFAQATIVYYLPGTTHALIQGESSNDSFCQCKYINTVICNNAYSISNLDNIPNTVTTDDVYLDANLLFTLFSFISDTNSTSYFLDPGSNHIIINDVRQFKVFQPCNSNAKDVVGSNVSIRGTDTTYIPIKYSYEKVDYIKVLDTVFVPLSPFKLLPPKLFIPELQNSGQKTDY